MQRKAKHLFLEFEGAEKYDEVMLKDLSDFFFKELNQEVKRPHNLIINIKGIGRFFPRNLRMRKRFNSDFKFYLSKYGDNIKRAEYFKEEIEFWKTNIYPKYDEYLKIKKEVNIKQREYYKKIEELSEKKESCDESCQDQS